MVLGQVSLPTGKPAKAVCDDPQGAAFGLR